MNFSQAREKVLAVQREMKKIIVGQDYVIEGLLTGLFGDGHIIVEGYPGLGKTLSTKTLARLIHGEFSRIQFVPDLMPHSIIGVQVFYEGEFSVKKGPLFANLVLADEINRAPPETQAALLQAMQEKEVTIGEETFQLPEVFLVMATINPVEQRGVWEMAETQIDRLMLKLKIDYPDQDSERRIVTEDFEKKSEEVEPVMNCREVLEIRKIIREDIYLDDDLLDYIVNIITETRKQAEEIDLGSSPRGGQAIWIAAKTRAFLEGRKFVLPEDIKQEGWNALRHRLILSRTSRAMGEDSEDMIDKIYSEVPICS